MFVRNEACCSSCGQASSCGCGCGGHYHVENDEWDEDLDDLVWNTDEWPAGGSLGLPTIDYGSAASTQPTIVGSVSVTNRYGYGPAGGALGLPVINFDTESEPSPPNTSHRHGANYPSGGALGPCPSLF